MGIQSNLILLFMKKNCFFIFFVQEKNIQKKEVLHGQCTIEIKYWQYY